MTINWVYFSDTNTPPGEIKTILEKKQFQLISTNEMKKLHQLLLENSQSILFLKAHTLYNEYDLCQKISIHYPHVYIILIVPDNGENIKKAMHMGASDILRSSFKEEELAEAINHARKFMEQKVNKEYDFTNLLKGSSRVFAVANSKGGIGRTLLTVNLATAFSRLGKRVAVIDGNLQFGEVSMYYNIKPKRTIYEWTKEGYGRPDNSIENFMSSNEAGVSVLAAPSHPEFFEEISEDHMKEAIEAAKKRFDIVLIDMPVHLSDIHLRCLGMADEILLLSVNDIAVIRIAKLYLELINSIKLKDKVKLIMNRQVKGQGLELTKIEEILGLKVYCTLPEQVNVAATSVKTGEPFILANSRSQLGKAVWHLAEQLLEELDGNPIKKKKQKRWFLIGN